MQRAIHRSATQLPIGGEEEVVYSGPARLSVFSWAFMLTAPAGRVNRPDAGGCAVGKVAAGIVGTAGSNPRGVLVTFFGTVIRISQYPGERSKGNARSAVCGRSASTRMMCTIQRACTTSLYLDAADARRKRLRLSPLRRTFATDVHQACGSKPHSRCEVALTEGEVYSSCDVSPGVYGIGASPECFCRFGGR